MSMTTQQFQERIRSNECTCLECPGEHPFRDHSLVEHINRAHKMTLPDYNQRHPGAAMLSPIAAHLLRALPRKSKTSDELEPLLAAYVRIEVSASQLDADLAKLGALMPPFDPQFATLVPKINPDFYLDAEFAHDVAYHARESKHLYVSGPTRCGKTEGVEQVFARMGRPIQRVNFNGGVTTASLFGGMRVDAKGTFFQKGYVPVCMPAGIPILADEVDFINETHSAGLHPVMEPRGTLFINETLEHVEAAPGFCFFGTGNTGGKGDATGGYTGTRVMNTAFIARFQSRITSGYLPADREEAMLRGRFPSMPDLPTYIKLANELRCAFEAHDISIPLSTGHLIEFCAKVVSGNYTRGPAFQKTYLNWLDEEQRHVLETVQRVFPALHKELKGD